MERIFLKRSVSVLALVLCAVVLPGVTGGCSYDPYTGFSLISDSESKTDPQKYDDKNNGLDASAWIAQAGDFEFEKAAAQIYYNGYPEEGAVLPASERSNIIEEYGKYCFDDSGTGVFLISDPSVSGEYQYGFYIEYTSDYGRTWKVCDSGFCSEYYPGDIKVRGNNVYIPCSSQINNDSFIIYSDDLCRTFQNIDVLSRLAQLKKQLEFPTGYLQILCIDDTDGSLVLGWYDADDPVYFGGYQLNSNEEKFYLILKTDSGLRSCSILYSDNKYIREKAYEYEHY